MNKKQIASRLRELRKELGLTQQAMAGVLGVGKSALSMVEGGRAALTDRNKQTLARVYGANPQWLETGRGEMFTKRWDFTEATSGEAPERIPLYTLSPDLTFSALLDDPDAHPADDYASIPGLPRCDGALAVPGDSMYPLLSPGDLVFYRQVRDVENAVFWGEMYLLSFEMAGGEYATLRYLHHAERPGHVRMTSENPRYPQQELPLNRIRALAFVCASLRVNALQ